MFIDPGMIFCFAEWMEDHGNQLVETSTISEMLFHVAPLRLATTHIF